MALDAAGGDGLFPQNPAALDDTPTRRFESGVDVLGSGFCFVQGFCVKERIALIMSVLRKVHALWKVCFKEKITPDRDWTA